MIFVPFFQASQNGDGIGFTGFFDHDNLETALQRPVFFKILPIFVQCGGTNRPQFATSQCRLQYIGGIHSARSLTRTYQRMNFIDKQNDFAIGFHYFVDYGF